MKKTISDLRTQEARPSLCEMFLDGEPFDVVHTSVITRFGFRIGLEIEQTVLQKLIAADELMRAKNHAKVLLESKVFSKERLVEELEKQAFSERSIRATRDYFERLGYLKDLKYAQNWVDSRQRSNPRSKNLLLHELLNKGVDGATADRVLRKIGDEDEQRLALQIAQKQVLRYNSLPQHVAERRLRGFLMRRGFDHAAIQRTVKQVLESE